MEHHDHDFGVQILVVVTVFAVTAATISVAVRGVGWHAVVRVIMIVFIIINILSAATSVP
jgi:hypothetical protein